MSIKAWKYNTRYTLTIQKEHLGPRFVSSSSDIGICYTVFKYENNWTNNFFHIMSILCPLSIHGGKVPVFKDIEHQYTIDALAYSEHSDYVTRRSSGISQDLLRSQKIYWIYIWIHLTLIFGIWHLKFDIWYFWYWHNPNTSSLRE